MPKSSKEILKEAKTLKKLNPTKKLSQFQNELAIREGYLSFVHLKSQEKARETEKRIKFAKSDSPSADEIIKEIHHGVAVYVREDGRRGLKALKDFKKGQALFVEKPFLWVGLSEDKYKEGLAWKLTRNIATKFPDAIVQMEEIGKLRESFRPKLNENDKKSLEDIAKTSKNSIKFIKKTYNLVCTYNTTICAEFRIGNDRIISYRMSISTGIAHANHSCIPNATRLPINTIEDFERNYEGLIATVDISKGQEITWNFLEDMLPRQFKSRQKELKMKFGFVCTCEKCLKDKREIRTK